MRSRLLLTSRFTLIPTSLSRNTVGSTSSFRPTSRYDTDDEIYVVTADTVLPDEPGHLPS